MQASTTSSRTSFSFLFIFMVLALWILPAGAVLAKDIHVPGDYPTIQQALDAAASGDRVLVAPGEYPEDIVFPGRAVSLVSESGPESTTIIGSGKTATVRFVSGETRDTLIQGFKITGGGDGGINCRLNSSPSIIGNVLTHNNGKFGGGIVCYASAPLIEDNEIKFNGGSEGSVIGGGIGAVDEAPQTLEIRNNVIKGNHAMSGGGISASHCSPLIEGNVIENNHAEHEGGGINLSYSDAEISRNRITFNKADISGGGICLSVGLNSLPFIHGNLITHNTSKLYGGGITADSDVRLVNNIIAGNWGENGGGLAFNGVKVKEVLHCTVAGNTASVAGGGIWSRGDSTGMVRNSIVWGNEAPEDAAIHVQPGGTLTVTYSDVEGE